MEVVQFIPPVLLDQYLQCFSICLNQVISKVQKVAITKAKTGKTANLGQFLDIERTNQCWAQPNTTENFFLKIICNIKEKTTLKGLSIVVSCAGIQDLRSLKNDQNYVFSSLKRSVFADFLCYLQCNKIQTDVLKQTLELLPSWTTVTQLFSRSGVKIWPWCTQPFS